MTPAYAACLADWQIDLDSALERVVLERTDVLRAARRVLHLAPQAGLDATLGGLARLDYWCAGAVDEELESLQLPFVAESFDIVICDGAATEGVERLPLVEIARMLRPGGRAILTAPAGDSEADFGELVAQAGFFAARIGESGEPAVFLCVRGEF